MRQPRSGPRPLPLHLTLSLSSWLSSPFGLMLSNSGWLANPELQNLAQSLLHAQNPAQHLAAASVLNLNKLLHGIERYRLHPYQRDLKEPEAVWQEGSSRLLDYGGKGPLALFVPSLINKAYILDLNKKRSLMRWLKTQGIHPLLLDWGTPGADEKDYNIHAYAERLERAVFHVKHDLHLVGYCMGGNIALEAAQRNKNRRLKSLALLATPWDFHAGGLSPVAALYKMWRPGCEAMGDLPVDLIQTLFTLLDPLGPQNKFMRFAEQGDEAEAESFVALEDWLNDGTPLTLGAADDCLLRWYGANRKNADPRAVNMPTLVMIPEQDKIVPPASAEALATALPQCMRMRVPLGHVGMIVSRHARQHVWEPLAGWLKHH